MVTSQLGKVKITGRQILNDYTSYFGQLSDRNVETTGLQLWKSERLTISMLRQIRATLGQRPFCGTHQQFPHTFFECD